MKVLVTGCCGFVGSRLLLRMAKTLGDSAEFFGIDNLCRPGSERNRGRLQQAGVEFRHGDLRLESDLRHLPRMDWVIDASANPSILAGVDDTVSSRQIVEHNLISTINLLEFCKSVQAGFILISSSRVYSINSLAALKLERSGERFVLQEDAGSQPCVSPLGVTEAFSAEPPVSLYGTTKRASELLALEYGAAFDLPVWINRCGILAAAGQFGRADQGIVAYWLHSWFEQSPLKYLGFDGTGCQTRDCLHPTDLSDLLVKQMLDVSTDGNRVFNVSGSSQNAFSLSELSNWCSNRFGPHNVESDRTMRRFDIPWLLLDSSIARERWEWKPQMSLEDILSEVAEHAESHPNWLSATSGH